MGVGRCKGGGRKQVAKKTVARFVGNCHRPRRWVTKRVSSNTVSRQLSPESPGKRKNCLVSPVYLMLLVVSVVGFTFESLHLLPGGSWLLLPPVLSW